MGCKTGRKKNGAAFCGQNGKKNGVQCAQMGQIVEKFIDCQEKCLVFFRVSRKMGCKKNGLQKCAPAIHFSTPHKKQGIRLPSIFCAPFLRKAFFCGPFFLPKYPKFLHGIHDPASQNVTIYQKKHNASHIFLQSTQKRANLPKNAQRIAYFLTINPLVFHFFSLQKNGVQCWKRDGLLKNGMQCHRVVQIN